ncbi:MAG: GNAT family N-acetyltransferase [Blastocatellia bacterium]
MDKANEPDIIIRPLAGLSEMHAAEKLQQEVWGIGDLETVHAAEMIAVQHAGGTVIGAFAGAELIGFVYGFPGYENGHVTIHSHLAAVKSAWRNYQTGARLKQAQRADALARGISEITWTYDPLQSMNAHFNFAKLGVTTRNYKVNFYGAEMTILVPGIGTDRFWVSWNLDSERVRRRSEGLPAQPDPAEELSTAEKLVEMTPGNVPRLNAEVKLTNSADALSLLVDIPAEIAAVQRESNELAIAWRETTREAFTSAFAAGYTAIEFFRQQDQESRYGSYLLCPSARADKYLR